MHARAQPPPPRAQVGAGVDVVVLETFTFLAEIKVAARPPPRRGPTRRRIRRPPSPRPTCAACARARVLL